MSNKPLVSTIIPSYNRSATLSEAVESALNQSYSPIEVIVVDDGSTDDTENKMASYRDRITFVREKHNGAAAARNAGIATSRGEFVAFLDADDIWRRHKIETQVQYLQSHPHIGILCSDAREFNENGTFSESFLQQFGKVKTEGFVFESIASTAFPLTSTVMVRRSCLNNHRFDERLTNFQDIDFYMRLNLHSPIATLRQVLVDRRLHTGNVSRSQYNRFYYRTIAFQNILTDGTVLSRRQRKTIRKLLSFACAKIGDCHWGNYELPEARQWYLKASGLDLVGMDSFLHAFLTFLPKDSISRVRRLRLAITEKFSL